MWLKSVIIFILIIMLLLIWKYTSSIYFNGTDIVQIPNSFLTKGQKDEISFVIQFPKDGVKDGIILLIRGSKPNNFLIAYIQDNNLIFNVNNEPSRSLIFIKDLNRYVEKESRFSIPIYDEFKDFPIYFGGAPNGLIPLNSLTYQAAGEIDIIQFPRRGLVGCVKSYLNNKINLNKLFQKQGLTYC
jgi:hypothetical protein